MIWWVWPLAVFLIFIECTCWYMFTPVVSTFADVVVTQYPQFQSHLDTVTGLFKVGWNVGLIVMILGTLAWAYMMSQRRDWLSWEGR